MEPSYAQLEPAASSCTTQRSSNLFLQALPKCIWSRWRPHLRRILLHQGQVITPERGAGAEVFFIEKGIVSHVVSNQSGFYAESSMVSREGFLGAHSSPVSFCSSVVQVPGKALVLPVQLFREELYVHRLLQDLLWKYQRHVIEETALIGFCNARHTLHQRLCRWLMATHERTGEGEIEITHSQIAVILGARRSGVTVALGELQSASLLQISRNRVVLLDSPGLSRKACECHGMLQKHLADWKGALHASNELVDTHRQYSFANQLDNGMGQ